MPRSSNARRGAPSRRSLLKGATACALPLPLTNGAVDPALEIAKRYCGLEKEQRRLCLAWQDVETWLFKHRNWPRLTEAEQALVPEAAQLRAIEAQLDEIDKLYDQVLPVLKTTPATTREGLLARLDALLWFLNPHDNEDAYPLLQSCQDDLKRLWL